MAFPLILDRDRLLRVFYLRGGYRGVKLVDDEVVDPVGLQLVEHRLDSSGFERAGAVELVIRADADIREEIPRDDRRLVAPPEGLECAPKADPLRAVRCVEHTDPVVKARLDDGDLRIGVRHGLVAELSDECVSAQDERGVRRRSHAWSFGLRIGCGRWD